MCVCTQPPRRRPAPAEHSLRPPHRVTSRLSEPLAVSDAARVPPPPPRRQGRKGELRGATFVAPARGSRHPAQLQFGVSYTHTDQVPARLPAPPAP